MADDDPGAPRFPKHPKLRQIAEAMEAAGMMGEMYDASFRCVFFSSESARAMGMSAGDVDRVLGLSQIVRAAAHDYERIQKVNRESGNAWFARSAPIMRRYVDPEDSQFEEVFGPAAQAAAEIDPLPEVPLAWHLILSSTTGSDLRMHRAIIGDMHLFNVRINDDDGCFLGLLVLYRSTVPEGLMWRLGRGDPALFERMDRVSEPGPRPSAILFADLAASGALSRRLSSRGYFDLIRSLTDLIDSSVVASGGIIGKHAGDGASALFLAGDYGGSESAAARAAVEAARAIRAGAAELGDDGTDVKVNVGLHWGSRLMIGQVSTEGRLEVTALGDPMNECARLEAVATDGAIIASKELIERLDPDDAAATKLDPDAAGYKPLAELEGADAKAIRDAGSIPVTEI